MRFRFERADGEEGLPVIPVISNYRLSTIEGRNGIGKTLAARLLELISGSQPFAALPNAWVSLGHDLGRVTVLIDHFPDGDTTLRCELDGQGWVGRTEKECAEHPGEVFINDRPATWEDARKLIRVRRIAGDEGLSETLGRSLRESSLVAYTVYNQTQQVVQRLGASLGTLSDHLVGISSVDLVAQRELLMSAARESQTAAKLVAELESSHSERQTEQHRHAALADSLGELPDVLGRYTAAIEEYRLAESRSHEAERTLEKLGRAQVVSDEQRSKYRRFTRLLPKRERALGTATFAERRVLQRLGLPERPTTHQISVMIGETSRKIAALTAQNKTADLVGTIRQVQEQFGPALRRMPAEAQDQLVVTLERHYSVRELADGVEARHRELEGVPKPGDVAAREGEIDQLAVRKRLLEQLPDLARTTDQKQTLVDEALQELQRMREGASVARDPSADAYSQVASTRNEQVTAAVAVSGLRNDVDSLIGLEPDDDSDPNTGFPSEESDDSDDDEAEIEGEAAEAPLGEQEIAERVSAWLREQVQFTDPRIRGECVSALASATDLSSRIEAVEAAVRAHLPTLAEEGTRGATELSSARSALDMKNDVHKAAAADVLERLQRVRAAARAMHDAGGAWGQHLASLSRVMERVGLENTAFEQLAEHDVSIEKFLTGDIEDSPALLFTRVVDVVNALADEIEASATRVRDAWATAAEYLTSASAELSPRLTDTAYNVGSVKAHARPTLQAWAEASLSDLLSSLELRRELFANSDVVTFSMDDHTVAWYDNERERRRRRPVEAFSSGEQVFAYTRAKLEQLRFLRQETQHVVVFLDEFGAFVARDRFAQLMSYIEHEALGEIADQIVVTLPLSGDLDRVVSEATNVNVQPERHDDEGYVVIPALSVRA